MQGTITIAAITSCVKILRANIKKRLLKEWGYICDDHDVLVRDEQGYHLNDDKIPVHDGQDEEYASRNVFQAETARRRPTASRYGSGGFKNGWRNGTVQSSDSRPAEVVLKMGQIIFQRLYPSNRSQRTTGGN